MQDADEPRGSGVAWRGVAWRGGCVSVCAKITASEQSLLKCQMLLTQLAQATVACNLYKSPRRPVHPLQRPDISAFYLVARALPVPVSPNWIIQVAPHALRRLTCFPVHLHSVAQQQGAKHASGKAYHAHQWKPLRHQDNPVSAAARFSLQGS